jgi:hypothetical protein
LRVGRQVYEGTQVNSGRTAIGVRGRTAAAANAVALQPDQLLGPFLRRVGDDHHGWTSPPDPELEALR